ncbi:protein FAM162B-like [Anomalospiza imberbis]|uniref:protein FAM162B-like n=1 Tax=Anomalospiza imberbis TaxID=187417 RepID=UPI00358F2EF1
MLGRLLGHSPGLWQWLAGPFLCSTRSAGSRAKNAQHMALQTDDPGKEAFRNDRRPTNFDKKVLVWSGCFKKEEDIPRHISYEVLDTARNIARIKVCYIMIAMTVLGWVTMIITGKEAVKKDQTLLRVNAEKNAKWRAEVKKGQKAAVGKSQ